LLRRHLSNSLHSLGEEPHSPVPSSSSPGAPPSFSTSTTATRMNCSLSSSPTNNANGGGGDGGDDGGGNGGGSAGTSGVGGGSGAIASSGGSRDQGAEFLSVQRKKQVPPGPTSTGAMGSTSPPLPSKVPATGLAPILPAMPSRSGALPSKSLEKTSEDAEGADRSPPHKLIPRRTLTMSSSAPDAWQPSHFNPHCYPAQPDLVNFSNLDNSQNQSAGYCPPSPNVSRGQVLLRNRPGRLGAQRTDCLSADGYSLSPMACNQFSSLSISSPSVVSNSDQPSNQFPEKQKILNLTDGSAASLGFINISESYNHPITKGHNVHYGNNNSSTNDKKICQPRIAPATRRRRSLSIGEIRTMNDGSEELQKAAIGYVNANNRTNIYNPIEEENAMTVEIEETKIEKTQRKKTYRAGGHIYARFSMISRALEDAITLAISIEKEMNLLHVKLCACTTQEAQIIDKRINNAITAFVVPRQELTSTTDNVRSGASPTTAPHASTAFNRISNSESPHLHVVEALHALATNILHFKEMLENGELTDDELFEGVWQLQAVAANLTMTTPFLSNETHSQKIPTSLTLDCAGGSRWSPSRNFTPNQESTK
jgi:hypothetical protein